MFADHKFATAVGSAGALVLLSHILLGPDVVPPLVALAGAVPLAAAALFLALVRRRSSDPDS